MALDWLFQGSPAPSVTGTTVSESGLPAWYQDYVKSLVMRASETAAAPYQPYGAARIAPFDPMQTKAQGMAPGVATVQQPYLDRAKSLTAGAAAPISSRMGDYVNPFMDDYLSQIGKYASRNLNENILPNINTTFTGGGTFGGTRHADFTNRAIRDTQEAVTDATQRGLFGGWTQAGEFAGKDLGRELLAGQNMGTLGQLAQQLGITGMGALSAAGAERRTLPQSSMDLAYQDFVRQQQYPFQQASFMSDVIRGTTPSIPKTEIQTSTQPSGFTPSPLAQFSQNLSFLQGLGELFG